MFLYLFCGQRESHNAAGYYVRFLHDATIEETWMKSKYISIPFSFISMCRCKFLMLQKRTAHSELDMWAKRARMNNALKHYCNWSVWFDSSCACVQRKNQLIIYWRCGFDEISRNRPHYAAAWLFFGVI